MGKMNIMKYPANSNELKWCHGIQINHGCEVGIFVVERDLI